MTSLASTPLSQGSVTVLHCPDKLALDPAPLAKIYAQMGEAEAEDMVCRALENIAQRLDRLQDARRANAFDQMENPARRVAVVAKQIGLTEVAQAGYFVADCARSMDGVALGATLARLERAFDTAVSQVWNFRDPE